MLSLVFICQNYDDTKDYIMIALKGKVKGESYERNYIFSYIPIMSSRI